MKKFTLKNLLFGDLILAAMLITGISPITKEDCKNIHIEVLNSVQELAVKWEIMDEREKRYILVNKEEFPKDLEVIRKRYKEFELENVPKVNESNYIPLSRPQINEMVKFNRSYLKHLEQRKAMELDRTEMLGVVIRETNELYNIYDFLRDAKCEFYYTTVRRTALGKLKNKLTNDQFYGIKPIPPVVPLWRFQEITK